MLDLSPPLLGRLVLLGQNMVRSIQVISHFLVEFRIFPTIAGNDFLF